MIARKKTMLGVSLALLFGLVLDLYLPLKNDFKKFDPVTIGHLDQKMWRSYYEKKPVLLFFQLAVLMRKQFHTPFVRSYKLAYYSAKAAFIFKKGKDRNDYEHSLPYLTKYFSALNDLSNRKFDYKPIARLELEWWIIRRDRESHLPSEWSDILARESEILYDIPKVKFKNYSDKRVDAMLLRDDKGMNITEADWIKIDSMCIDAWTSMKNILE